MIFYKSSQGFQKTTQSYVTVVVFAKLPDCSVINVFKIFNKLHIFDKTKSGTRKKLRNVFEIIIKFNNFRVIVSSKLESKQMFSQNNVEKRPLKFRGIPPGGILLLTFES